MNSGQLGVAAAGIPLGQGIRRGWARYRARRWSRRRVKIRRRLLAAVRERLAEGTEP